MESVIKPVTLMRAECPFCGNMSSRFALAVCGLLMLALMIHEIGAML